MQHFAESSPIVLCLITVFFGALASLSPLSPVEPVLVGIAMVAPTWLLLPLVILATLSHMSTKTLVFLAGSKVERALRGKALARYDQARNRLTGHTRLQRVTLFVSGVVGVPPFYVVTAVCGALKMPLREFLVLGATGRSIRFAVLMFIPQLFRATPLQAQGAVPPAIRVSGTGPETYVLLSGLVGGVAGFDRIERELVVRGHRVISIDPYQLSIDSTELSFDAIARRVAAELGARGVRSARVVGHAHGGGVAVRLAANAPDRVTELFLLDVGAQLENNSPVFGSALRLVPLIIKLPFARGYVTGRFLDGLRENAERTEWIDSTAQRTYVQPVLDNLKPIITMAGRLARAREPEPIADVVARIRIPVTIILGEFRKPAGPNAEELEVLKQLGARVRFETVRGAGHFPHEEAPRDVVRFLVAGQIVAVRARSVP